MTQPFVKNSYFFKHFYLAALFLFALCSGCAVNVTGDMVVSPSKEIDQAALAKLKNEHQYQELTIKQDEVELYALQKKHKNAKNLILVFHGNALNLTLQPWYLSLIHI